MLDKAELILAGASDTLWYWPDQPDLYWEMGLHGLVLLSTVALIGITVLVLIRSPARSRTSSDNSAHAVLDIRYACGEIRRGEYLERKRDLS
jgi:uncharacterized membrane protein